MSHPIRVVSQGSMKIYKVDSRRMPRYFQSVISPKVILLAISAALFLTRSIFSAEEFFPGLDADQEVLDVTAPFIFPRPR